MSDQVAVPGDQQPVVEGSRHDEDLDDLLQVLRVLLPGVQTLTAFLIILPFSQGFPMIERSERWIYLATFVCSVSSLVLFTAPAAQHRLQRPLRNRVRFKQEATHLIVIGLVPLSLAVILATDLVVTEIGGRQVGIVAAALVAALIGVTWWLVPLRRRTSGEEAVTPVTARRWGTRDQKQMTQILTMMKNTHTLGEDSKR